MFRGAFSELVAEVESRMTRGFDGFSAILAARLDKLGDRLGAAEKAIGSLAKEHQQLASTIRQHTCAGEVRMAKLEAMLAAANSRPQNIAASHRSPSLGVIGQVQLAVAQIQLALGQEFVGAARQECDGPHSGSFMHALNQQRQFSFGTTATSAAALPVPELCKPARTPIRKKTPLKKAVKAPTSRFGGEGTSSSCFMLGLSQERPVPFGTATTTADDGSRGAFGRNTPSSWSGWQNAGGGPAAAGGGFLTASGQSVLAQAFGKCETAAAPVFGKAAVTASDFGQLTANSFGKPDALVSVFGQQPAGSADASAFSKAPSGSGTAAPAASAFGRSAVAL